MLTGLWIREVVLIESLDLIVGPGLTALTGETGAGKSILLDALGLATGARAESGLVRQGAARPAPPQPFHFRPAMQSGASSRPGGLKLRLART